MLPRSPCTLFYIPNNYTVFVTFPVPTILARQIARIKMIEFLVSGSTVYLSVYLCERCHGKEFCTFAERIWTKSAPVSFVVSLAQVGQFLSTAIVSTVNLRRPVVEFEDKRKKFICKAPYGWRRFEQKKKEIHKKINGKDTVIPP